MKRFHAVVHTDTPETLADLFANTGVASMGGVKICLTSFTEAPPAFGATTLVSVAVTLADGVSSAQAAAFLQDNLVGETNAIVMLHDTAAYCAQDIQAVIDSLPTCQGRF